jgi:hypothetical protein
MIAIQVDGTRSGLATPLVIVDDYTETLAAYLYRILSKAFEPLIIARSYVSFNDFSQPLSAYPLLKVFRYRDVYQTNSLFASTAIGVQHCMVYPINNDISAYGINVAAVLIQALRLEVVLQATGIQLDTNVPIQVEYDTQLNADYKPVASYTTVTFNIYTSAM